MSIRVCLSAKVELVIELILRVIIAKGAWLECSKYGLLFPGDHRLCFLKYYLY
jgi:hypothetical protein